MGKLNCWEYMQCGRQPGGENTEQHGVCPVTIDKRLDGAHQGNNGGRTCWLVGGTECREFFEKTRHQDFAMKYHDCTLCEFYNHVRFEEAPGFFPGESLLDKDL